MWLCGQDPRVAFIRKGEGGILDDEENKREREERQRVQERQRESDGEQYEWEDNERRAKEY